MKELEPHWDWRQSPPSALWRFCVPPIRRFVYAGHLLILILIQSSTCAWSVGLISSSELTLIAVGNIARVYRASI